MDKIDDWRWVSGRARDHRVPVVVLVDQADCPYCRRVEGEYFAAILAGGEFSGKALFGKISLDAGESINTADGSRVSTRDFLLGYRTGLTPTVLFLDADGKELVEKMVGLGTPDYYGYYLEQSIRQAYALVNG